MNDAAIYSSIGLGGILSMMLVRFLMEVFRGQQKVITNHIQHTEATMGKLSTSVDRNTEVNKELLEYLKEERRRGD